MKKKTTLDIISESERATLYSISFEKDGTTEFEKFVAEFEMNAKYNSDYQKIIAALQVILDRGALERFFRPEGKRYRPYYFRDMNNKQEWFKSKVEKVSPDIMAEMQMSAGIIARIDKILKEKHMSQRDLARKMGKNEAVVSRWITGFPNFTLRTLSQISVALGEPLIRLAE